MYVREARATLIITIIHSVMMMTKRTTYNWVSRSGCKPDGYERVVFFFVCTTKMKIIIIIIVIIY